MRLYFEKMRDQSRNENCEAMMSLKSPYNQGARKETLNSVVVFADVLGFRAAMKAAYEAGNGQRLLDRFSEAVESSYHVLQAKLASSRYLEPRASWDFKAFTDNVVIGFPVADDGEHEMLWILDDLAIFQLMMVQKGFFVRGGVSVGEHYMDSNIVFGSALIEAYDAESRLARDPRIVLGESAVRNFKRSLSYYSKAEYSWHYNFILKDSDGQLFLNYLAVSLPFGYETVCENVGKHKQSVLEKLEEFAPDPYIRSKYSWVANYHNYFCEQYDLAPDLKIDSGLLQISPQRIDDEFELVKAAVRSSRSSI